MNSLKISDVTSYDFNLLGTGVELVVRQATGSTTIHLLPAHKDQPIAVTALPAEVPAIPTPIVTTTPRASTSSTPKRRRKIRRAGGASRNRKFQAQGAVRPSDGMPLATKLTDREVRLIRELWPDALQGAASKRQALLQLAEMFDISSGNIDQIISNKTWRHLL